MPPPATPYLDALSANIPISLTNDLHRLRDLDEDLILETIVRFVAGAPCEGNGKPSSFNTTEWESKQAHLLTTLHHLQPNLLKRARDDCDIAGPFAMNGASTSKKPKMELEAPAVDSNPLYTLHSVSMTSPLRKKLDVTMHSSAMQFTNPNTHAVEGSVLLSLFKRAFVLPTRGKTKAHWTVVLMSSDYVEQDKKVVASTSSQVQVIFGIDANPTIPFATTDNSSSPRVKQTHEKSTATFPFILSFLSHMPNHAKPIIQPSTTIFSSKVTGVPGIDAYRAAKSGTLWFMEQGILWGESKPCEFWALEDLDGEGVRMISATGRTCSVYLLRRNPASPEDEDNAGNDEEDTVPEAIETEFSMVEGKEQDAIREWVRRFKSSFGRKRDIKGKGKPIINAKAKANPWKSSDKLTINDIPLSDSDDEDDEDFEMNSESNDSRGSGSESGCDSNDSESEGADDYEEDDDEEEEDVNAADDEEAELDPADHPLLRPGAMPRMSKGMIDMVVGMMGDKIMDASNDKDKASAADEEGASEEEGTLHPNAQTNGEQGDGELDELED